MKVLEIGEYTLEDGVTLERTGKFVTVRQIVGYDNKPRCYECKHFGHGRATKCGYMTTICLLQPKKVIDRDGKELYYHIGARRLACEKFEKNRIMNGTLIYLKTICDQLKEVLGLCDELNVGAMIDDKEDPHKVLGWCIVRLLPDGHIRPIDSKRYHTIREMIKSMQGEPVSEDLEKAIDSYLATYWGGEKEKQDWPFLKKMAIHFANWQKEQMIAKAINTKASLTMSVPSICISLPLGVNVGDKVKVIVIKEE